MSKANPSAARREACEAQFPKAEPLVAAELGSVRSPNTGVLAGALIAQGLLSLRVRGEKSAAKKIVFAVQGAIAIYAASLALDKFKSNRPTSAAATLVAGGAAVAALNRLNQIKENKNERNG